MKTNPSLPALTGIRAIAAYMVFIHHYNPFCEARFGTTIHSFFSQFHIGVTIFFVFQYIYVVVTDYKEFKKKLLNKN